MRVGVLASHPIQYYAPWFRALAKHVDLTVYFAHRQSSQEQAEAGFGVRFDWDVDVTSGYNHHFLTNVARTPSVHYFRGCDTPEINQIIANDNFDAFIVCGWYLKSYLQAARACRQAHVPVLVRGDSQLATTGSLLKRLAKAITHRVLLRRFDGFLYVGKRNAEYLKHYGASENRMFFVPHFVDNDWFRRKAKAAQQARAEIRGKWRAAEETIVLLFVGKFQPIKRPADILHALASLAFLNIEAVAVFIGAGELEESLRAKASALGVNARFEGFKNQSQLPSIYAASDMLVLPSQSETWGLVVNEAMACGIPVIVSDRVGCAVDLIDEGKTGFAFSCGDHRALASRIRDLAQKNFEKSELESALAAKMSIFSVETAVKGTMRALETFAC